MKIYRLITTALIYLCLSFNAVYAIDFKHISAQESHPEIWYQQTDTVPIIAMQISFPVGYAFDPKDKLGLATLLAATLDEGAGNLNSDSFRKELVNRQIHLSYSASSERLTLNLNFFKFDSDKALELGCLSLNKPRFDQENINLMQSQLIASIENSRKEPSALAHRLLQKTYYQNHAFSQSSIGTIETLKNIKRDDLIKLHKNITQENAFVSVVGDMSKKEIIAFTEKLLGDIPKESDSNMRISEYRFKPVEKSLAIYSDVPQTTILMATPAVKRTSKDFFAYYLATHILGGGGFGSYLVDTLREKEGLTYSASSHLDSSLYDGRLIIEFATDNKKVDKALSQTKKILNHLAQNGITQKELDKAKINLKGQYELMFETNNDIASLAQNLYSYKLPYNYPMKRADLFNNVKLSEINSVMKKLFTQPIIIITAGGNKQLKQFQSVPLHDIDF